MTSLTLLLAAILPALPPDIQPDAPQICAGSSVVLDAGAGYQRYEWSTGEGTRWITVSPLESQLYSVSVVDAAEATQRTMEAVTVHPAATVSVSATPAALCSDPTRPVDVMLTATAGFLTYAWSCDAGTVGSGSHEAKLHVPTAFVGDITCGVVVSDQNGCTASAATVVTVTGMPWAFAGPDRIACTGDTITLDSQSTGGLHYQWFPTTGLDDPNSPRPRLTVGASESYTLFVTGYNGCESQDTMRVTALDPAARHPLGNSLFLVKLGPDLMHVWSDLDDIQDYRLEAATVRDFAAIEVVGNTGPEIDLFVEDARMTYPGSRFYRVTGSPCP